MPPSSRGLGHIPFTDATRVRIPLGVPIFNNLASRGGPKARALFSIGSRLGIILVRVRTEEKVNN
jgi:hypothetical protein